VIHHRGRPRQPRIQKQKFDVEDQEQDGDKIELHVKRLARVTDRIHPRLVRHLLDGGLFLRANEVNDDQVCGDESDQDGNKQQDRISTFHDDSAPKASRNAAARKAAPVN
jgi:hypothetical protein